MNTARPSAILVPSPMPTFDFQCAKCGTVFEFARPFGSKATPACPKCKSKKTEKLLTPPAIQFKGSGWYKTDSRKPQEPKKEPAQEKKEAQSTAPKSSGEGSSKPTTPSQSTGKAAKDS